MQESESYMMVGVIIYLLIGFMLIDFIGGKDVSQPIERTGDYYEEQTKKSNMSLKLMCIVFFWPVGLVVKLIKSIINLSK